MRFDRDAYTAKLETGLETTDEGVEEAFELIVEVSEGWVILNFPTRSSGS